jgi:hypothetical protein
MATASGFPYLAKAGLDHHALLFGFQLFRFPADNALKVTGSPARREAWPFWNAKASHRRSSPSEHDEQGDVMTQPTPDYRSALALAVCGLAMALSSSCGGSHQDPGGNTNPGQPPPTNTITGTLSLKGVPLPGAKVILFQTNISAIVQTAVTGANGTYSFTAVPAWSNVNADFLIWPLKAGYGFYPAVGAGAAPLRCGQNAFLQGNKMTDIGMDVTTIHYVSTPNAPLAGADFTAYDGSAPLVTLPRTGQTVSYVPGDDAAQGKGAAWPATRFTDNQDGTVSDHLTGLTWLKNAGALSPTTWSIAVTLANQLASGISGLADGSKAGDWRLPNLSELESLVDVSASNPALSAGHPFANVSGGIFWSSTSYAGGNAPAPEAWAVRLSDGRYINDFLNNVKATSNNGVWPVKGKGGGTVKLRATGLWWGFAAGDDGSLLNGVPLTYPRWINNGDGTVTDTMTGLVWLQQADAIHLPWADAVAAVNGLASGQYGLKDGSKAGSWRMPNRAELQSLSDRAQPNLADYFNDTFYNLDGSVYLAPVFKNFVGFQYYWTSSTRAADPSEAWTVFSCDFGVYDTPKASVGYTLAVR